MYGETTSECSFSEILRVPSFQTNKQNIKPRGLSPQQTIPTERPPLVSDVRDNFYG
jgi:hypothetical protein